jgi:hypothetical protein
MKRFLCIWTGSLPERFEVKDETFFTTENGYSRYTRHAANRFLEPGMIYMVKEGEHFIIRLADEPVQD